MDQASGLRIRFGVTVESLQQRENDVLVSCSDGSENACDLVASFVKADFTKIHLDASMPCIDDPLPLPDAVIAERAATLAKVAEATAGHDRLRYVIGTEVPTPAPVGVITVKGAE